MPKKYSELMGKRLRGLLTSAERVADVSRADCWRQPNWLLTSAEGSEARNGTGLEALGDAIVVDELLDTRETVLEHGRVDVLAGGNEGPWTR